MPDQPVLSRRLMRTTLSIGRWGRTGICGRMKMPYGAPPNVRLGELLHPDRGLYARLDAFFFERVLHRKGVDHGRQHPHVVGRRTVGALSRRGEAPDDVPSTDDNSELRAEVLRLYYLSCDRGNHARVDAESVLRLCECLPRELEQNSVVLGGRREIVAHDENSSAPPSSSGGGTQALLVSPTRMRQKRPTVTFSPMLALASSIKAAIVFDLSWIHSWSIRTFSL